MHDAISGTELSEEAGILLNEQPGIFLHHANHQKLTQQNASESKNANVLFLCGYVWPMFAIKVTGQKQMKEFQLGRKVKDIQDRASISNPTRDGYDKTQNKDTTRPVEKETTVPPASKIRL